VERATRYDAIIATFVGVLALLVSAYTAVIQRRQVRAQVYPIIELTSGYGDEEIHVHLANKGSGPAIIRNVLIKIDGKPIHGWEDLLAPSTGKSGGLRQTHSLDFSSFGTSVMAPGETKEVFKFSCVKPDKKSATEPPKPIWEMGPLDPECNRLLKRIQAMNVSLCYCSTLDDCFMMHDEPHVPTTTEDVRRCAPRSDDSFY
jgi:hypothetical protein